MVPIYDMLCASKTAQSPLSFAFLCASLWSHIYNVLKYSCSYINSCNVWCQYMLCGSKTGQRSLSVLLCVSLLSHISHFYIQPFMYDFM